MSQYVYLPDGSQAQQVISRDDKVIYPFDKQAQLKVQIENNTTPLGANATYTGATFDTLSGGEGFTVLTGHVFANQSGNLYVEQSGDGTNWERLDTIAITASTPAKINVDVLSRYVRLVLTNGASAQGTLRLFAYAGFKG